MRTNARISFAACSLALCAALLATPARAAEPAVALEPPAGTTCVNQRELGDALVRAGVVLAGGADYSPDVIVDPFATGTPEPVVVTLRGTPDALVVGIARHGATQTNTLPAASCETATDVAAAFLASTLAPAVAPVLPLDSARATTSRSSTWREPVEPARRDALRLAFRHVPTMQPRWLVPSLEVLLGGLALALPGVAAQTHPFSLTDSALIYTSGVVFAAGGVGGFMLGRDRGTDLMMSALWAGQGFFFASSAFPSTSFGRAAHAGGFFGAAALALPNLVHGRRLDRANADKAELKGGELSRGRAAELEADLREVDPQIPIWLIYTPPVVGFTVAAVGDLTNKHVSQSYGSFDVAFAGTYLVYAMFAVGGTVWGSYERMLHRAGLQTLSLGPAPGASGLSLRGTF